MSLAKRVAHNTIIQIAGKIISTVLGLLALAFITRYLGRTGFGEYTTVLTFLTFFAVIADFGLTLVTVQMISARGNEENKILNNIFSLRLISIIAVLGLAPLIVIFFPYSQAIKIGVLVALASFIFPALNQVIIGLFQKKLSMGRDAVAEVISRLVLLIGIILTKKLDAGLNGILWASVASAAASFAGHYLLAAKFAFIKLEFDWAIWKQIWFKSWPLAITIVLNLIYLRADILFLSLFRGVDEVGLYGATYKVIDVLTTVPFMFAGLILPILTTAWSDKASDYFKRVLQKSFDFMAFITIPLIVGAQFLGRPIMTAIAGKDFAASGLILQILIFGVAAVFLGTMFSHAVIALDRQKKMIGYYIFTSLTAVAAYLFLIPKYSYFGAAAVTIYSEVLIAIFSAICVFKYSRFRPNLVLSLKSLASAAIMGLGLYWLAPFSRTGLSGLIIVIIAAGAIYFIVLCLLGGVKRSDLEIIFSRQKKSGGPTYNNTNF
ncbi:MAG: flippase [Candidatus Falkowbacteria bacterium]|nr:flippase [Candidatus Falkowbacteria bacterium]